MTKKRSNNEKYRNINPFISLYLQYQKYTSLLEKAGITYRTKARDLSSPSLFSMGTRERAGTAFQKVNYQTLYTIYVRKVDYERAVHVIIV